MNKSLIFFLQNAFILPTLFGFFLMNSAAARLDQNRESFSVIPQEVLNKAEKLGAPYRALSRVAWFFQRYNDSISNKDYVTIVDLTPHSSKARKFLLSLKTGEVYRLLAAHGKGTDRNHDGFADEFSNISGSHMSSLGIYLTAERYWGRNGLSMRLDGLESSNSKARPRAIVVHGADYVRPDRPVLGRSYGCPSVERRWTKPLIDRIEEGSLYLVYHEKLYQPDF